MKEIGSEFHRIPPDLGKGLIYPRPGSLVFSGRTAIEAVLNETTGIRTALLPSYCCDSMIAPFRNADIDIKFFDVNWDGELKVEINDNADALIWCNYFGFKNEMPIFDGIIIEDITHSLLSTVAAHPESDYLVASLRKWEPILCGGYCSVEFEGTNPPKEFISLKTEAMELKTRYLSNPKEIIKSKYLSMFSESNRWIADYYSGLSIDYWSREYLEKADMERQRNIRRENARVLYEGLKGKVQFMFPIDDMDCPLFVPIILDNRNEIRAFLTNNEIYCPVHWPKPEGCDSNIYNKELSLICDQRYGSEDMERIVSTLLQVL